MTGKPDNFDIPDPHAPQPAPAPAPVVIALVNEYADVRGRIEAGTLCLYEGRYTDARRIMALASEKLIATNAQLNAYNPDDPQPADPADQDEAIDDIGAALRDLDQREEGIMLDMTIGAETKALRLRGVEAYRKRLTELNARRRLAEGTRRRRGGG